MKKIALLIFLCGIAYGQTRTSIFKLPQWSTGDTLKAGTANDSAQSNFGLNNAFYRLEALLSRQINASGFNTALLGAPGTTNFVINADYGNAPARIVLGDSTLMQYNFTAEQNGLVYGNLTVGGYITADSLVSGGDLWINNDLGVAGNTTVYGLLSSLGTIASDVGITANTDILANETFTIGENVGGYTATSGTQAKMYVKDNYFIVMFNDGGTYKYRYMDLSSTNANWTYSTSEP